MKGEAEIRPSPALGIEKLAAEYGRCERQGSMKRGTVLQQRTNPVGLIGWRKRGLQP